MTDLTTPATERTEAGAPGPGAPRPLPGSGSPTDAVDPAGGVVAGRYATHSRIVRDGDATVFRGHDRVLCRAVAITLFPVGAREPAVSRQLRTARILAGMTHPALLTVYDAGLDHQRGFVITQLVEGPSLAERLRAGALSVPATLRIGAALAGGLAGVHRHGLIHRALYPGGVWTDVLDRVYLGDFSVARAVGAGESAAITEDLVADSDPGSYLAPEQVRGDPVGPAADVYSLGLILLECVTGHREYPGEPVTAATARLHRAPHVPADLPDPLITVLSAMTADEPEDRPAAGDVAGALRRLARTLTDPRSVVPDPAPVDPDPDDESPPTPPPDPDPPEPTPEEPPADDPSPEVSGTAARGHRAPARRWRRGPVVLIVVLGLLLGLAAGTAIGVAGTRQHGTTPVASAAPAEPSGPATLYGTVTAVPDPATVVVDVAGTPVTVAVLGIDPAATFACARDGARAFAQQTLDGQRVTLVPDPTLRPDPAASPAGARRAYVVLASQLSYTDAAIRAGWAAPGSDPVLYRSAFDAETSDARAAGLGMWSPTC